MSEEERKIRSNYRKVRKRLINLQVVVLVLVLLVAFFSTILSTVLDKTYYVDYSEKSSIDYGVYLKENNFYEDSYLGNDYAYIASLIDKVQAKFKYELKMQSQDLVNFEYNYRVDAVVQIKHKSSGRVLFAPVYNEIEQKNCAAVATQVSIDQLVAVDYEKYNEIADNFIRTYDLATMADASLILQLHVNVLGTSDEFMNNTNNNSYVASVSIPLTTQTVDVKITSTVPPEVQKVLSFTTEDIANTFRSVAIVSASISALLAIVLWLYAYLSRNVDITYDIKVARIVRNYKSFIQKLRNAFNVSSYQLLVIDSFNEMLEIRDTIQSPILMEENADKTCTKFYIPTDSKLLYLYEIKVDDYDEIYGSINDEENTVEELPIPLRYEEAETDAGASNTEEIKVENNAESDDANYETVMQTVTPVERRVFTVYSKQKKVLSDLYRFADVTATVVERPASDEPSNENTACGKVSEHSVYVRDFIPKVQKAKLRMITPSDKQ